MQAFSMTLVWHDTRFIIAATPTFYRCTLYVIYYLNPIAYNLSNPIPSLDPSAVGIRMTLTAHCLLPTACRLLFSAVHFYLQLFQLAP